MTGITRGNLREGVPEGLGAGPEFVECVAAGANARVERLVSRGHSSPPGFWYEQPEWEWVLLVSGRARLVFEPDTIVDLAPGDHVTIPSRMRHRLDWTDPEQDCVWIAVFFQRPPA